MHARSRLICTRIIVSGGGEGVGSAVFICLANGGGGGSGNWFHLFWLIERARRRQWASNTTLGPGGGGGGGEEKSALCREGRGENRAEKTSARVVYDTRAEC